MRALILVVVVGLAAAACASPPSDDRTVMPTELVNESASADADAGLSLRFATLTERDLDPQADGENATAAIESLNRFSVDLYRVLADDDRANLIVSPYSTAFALGMIAAGAAGRTADEMKAALHVDPQTDWHEGINAYDLSLHTRTTGTETTWATANKVWVEPGLTLRPEYLDVLTGRYGSPVAEGDFGADPDAVRRQINRWVEQRTDGLLGELFREGSITEQTRLALVNAVALDALWEFPFDPDRTFDAGFRTESSGDVAVPMMHYDEFLPNHWSDELQAVELPYGDGALSMVVIVPEDLRAFEASLTIEELDRVVGLIGSAGIHLSLPRWTARSHLRLDDALQELGMTSAFSDADFSGMVEGGELALSAVEHEAYVEVSEAGTRAAAATGGAMAASHGPTIEVNRPFFYVIRDRGAGTILFMGRVTDPTAA